MATCEDVESKHSSCANESLRRIVERLMVTHHDRGNQSCGVAVNPALGTPSSWAGGVKAHPVGRTLSDVMFELGKLHQQSVQTDVCRPNALIRRPSSRIKTSIHKRHAQHLIRSSSSRESNQNGRRRRRPRRARQPTAPRDDTVNSREPSYSTQTTTRELVYRRQSAV